MSHSSKTAIGLLLGAQLLLPGCLRRRMLVRSNPPGAMVYVDNQQIGMTPCSTDFIYYGTREIRLVKPGYETLTVDQPIPAPWYEIPPLDFVSENMVPREIQDYRTLAYNLTPQAIVPTNQLLGRAQQLRQATNQTAGLPTGSLGLPGEPIAPGGPIVSDSYNGSEVIAAPTPAAPTVLGPQTYGNGNIPPGGQPLEPMPAPVR
jgi:hypothetical protein